MGIINEDYQPTNISEGVPACSYWAGAPPSTIMTFLGIPPKNANNNNKDNDNDNNNREMTGHFVG